MGLFFERVRLDVSGGCDQVYYPVLQRVRRLWLAAIVSVTLASTNGSVRNQAKPADTAMLGYFCLALTPP